MHETFQPTVYILANRKNGATYVGVTSDLIKRIQQHREENFKGHSKRVGAKKLMWFEQHMTMETAITREKRIKEWKRPWKIEMIEQTNPDWRDLAVDFGFEALPSLVVSNKKDQVMDSGFRRNDEGM